MERILCIVGGMNAGGAETFLMKLFRAIDKNKIMLDFCVFSDKKCFYDDEIISLGGRIFHVIPKTKNPLKCFLSIRKIVMENNYKIVFRTSQNSMSSLDLLAARFGGAKKLVFRSSNSRACGTFLEEVMHYIFKPLINSIVNIKIAPSEKASKFMFGLNSDVIILKNGLDLNTYHFSHFGRDRVRKEFNIEDKFVVGHIGRFSYQKNHGFLIDIFAEIKKKKNDAVLLLIGEGELKMQIQNKIEQLGLDDSVIFAGIRKDIPDLLSSMDVFVFPSFYEGMPNVAIEAQASGLQCFVSDTITKQIAITDLVNMESIKLDAIDWADKIYNIYSNISIRVKYSAILKRKCYDINDIVKEFTKIMIGSNL